ncbi:hypothetical protein CDAR_432261 [Caerostris darwini]|uniref:Uncharacterized protein n=1 Tax=Caerostris darwini TaxID=1538125 RepID=A0AAV4U2V2_9ARAC|nr:hypothetical protein CDAR_432261 [Caerostris darwini]
MVLISFPIICSGDPPFLEKHTARSREQRKHSAISGYVFFEALEGHSPVSNLNSKQKADAIVPLQKQSAPSSQPTATARSKGQVGESVPSEIKDKPLFLFAPAPCVTVEAQLLSG